MTKLKKNSKIMTKLKMVCDEYWRTRASAHTYFWLDFLIYRLLKMDRECAAEFENMPRIEADKLTQSHGLARTINGVEKMDLDIPEFKQAMTEHPPYVLKLWGTCNMNKLRSNALYAIEMSKHVIVKKHEFNCHKN